MDASPRVWVRAWEPRQGSAHGVCPPGMLSDRSGNPLGSQPLEHPPGACGIGVYEVTPHWVPLSRFVDDSSGQEQSGAGWVTGQPKRGPSQPSQATSLPGLLMLQRISPALPPWLPTSCPQPLQVSSDRHVITPSHFLTALMGKNVLAYTELKPSFLEALWPHKTIFLQGREGLLSLSFLPVKWSWVP